MVFFVVFLSCHRYLFVLPRSDSAHSLSFPGSSRKEITEHWEWLEHNLLQTLSIFENENDITTFVKGKVQVIQNKMTFHAGVFRGD